MSPTATRLVTLAFGLSLTAAALPSPQQPEVPPPSPSPKPPKPRPSRSPGPGVPSGPSARLSKVLVTTDLACDVSVDFKKRATLPAGGHVTLEIEPGERVITAVTPQGAQWKKTVKVGGEQTVVEISFAGVAKPASDAEVDTAAARVVKAVTDVRGAAGFVAWVMEKKPFGFHDVDLTVSLLRAQAGLKRELASLQALQPADARARVREELLRAGDEAGQMVALLAEAVSAAQQQNSSLGAPAQKRAQALAHMALAVPEAGVLSSLRGSAPYRTALSADLWPAAGLDADPQDFRLGADYDGDSPPRIGTVEKGGVADTLGLRPGDRVLSVDGRPVTDAWKLKLALRAAAGRSVQLEIQREGKREKRKASVPAALPR